VQFVQPTHRHDRREHVSDVLPLPIRRRADLRYPSARHQLALQDHHGCSLMQHVVCLFTPQLTLVLIAPIHRGMARLSRPGWLVLSRAFTARKRPNRSRSALAERRRTRRCHTTRWGNSASK